MSFSNSVEKKLGARNPDFIYHLFLYHKSFEILPTNLLSFFDLLQIDVLLNVLLLRSGGQVASLVVRGCFLVLNHCIASLKIVLNDIQFKMYDDCE